MCRSSCSHMLETVCVVWVTAAHSQYSVCTNTHLQTGTHTHHRSANLNTHRQRKTKLWAGNVKNTACVMWKPHTSSRHSAAQRSEERSRCSSSSTTNAPGPFCQRHWCKRLCRGFSPVWCSLTLICVHMNMQRLSSRPTFGFSQSRTRISPASREPTHFNSSLSRLFYTH